jgi:ribosomal protein L34E
MADERRVRVRWKMGSISGVDSYTMEAHDYAWKALTKEYDEFFGTTFEEVSELVSNYLSEELQQRWETYLGTQPVCENCGQAISGVDSARRAFGPQRLHVKTKVSEPEAQDTFTAGVLRLLEDENALYWRGLLRDATVLAREYVSRKETDFWQKHSATLPVCEHCGQVIVKVQA